MMNIISGIKPTVAHGMLSPSPAANAWRRAGVLTCAAWLAACATPAMQDSRTQPTAATAYATVIASTARTDQDRSMDASRHPAELLAFANVRPGMRVLDVSAGGGYTTELLALAVGPEGRVFAQAPKPSEALAKRFAKQRNVNVVIVAHPFDEPIPTNLQPLDLVTLILNYHDISYLPVDRNQMNRRIYAALKPGGAYVIVDHAARAGTGIADGKTLHRIDEATVVAEVTAAGFKLASEGTFMRNPADDRAVSSGAATVPTDRFVLRFVKPG